MLNPPKSTQELLKTAIDKLNSHQVLNPRLDALVLLSHLLKLEKEKLLAGENIQTQPEIIKLYEKLIIRRCEAEPVAYITGRKEFMTLDFQVNHEVLIPRPETETLVEKVLELTKANPELIEMLDIGTGSGCIAVSCLHFNPQLNVTAIDVSPKALETAQRNAELLLTPTGLQKQIQFLQSDLFKKLTKKKYHLIASNPPYISKGALAGLALDIQNYEPRMALDGGKDGLDIIRKIIEKAPTHLYSQGYLIMEIGYDQGERIKKIIERNSAYKLESIQVIKDLANLDRVILVQKG